MGSSSEGIAFTINADDQTRAAWNSALHHAKSFGKESAHAVKESFEAVNKIIEAPIKILSSLRTFALFENAKMLAEGFHHVAEKLAEWTDEGLKSEAVTEAFAHKTETAGDAVFSLARQMQEASNGALSLDAAMQKTLSGMSKGLDVNQIQELFKLLSIKAKLSGRDFSEMFSGVSSALVTGRVLALNQLGLLRQGLRGVSEEYEKANKGMKWDNLAMAQQKGEIVKALFVDVRSQLSGIGMTGKESSFAFDRMFKALEDVQVKLKEMVATSPGILSMADGVREFAEQSRTFVNSNFEEIKEAGIETFTAIARTAEACFGVITDFKADPVVASFELMADAAEGFAQAMAGVKDVFSFLAASYHSIASVMGLLQGTALEAARVATLGQFESIDIMLQATSDVQDKAHAKAVKWSEALTDTVDRSEKIHRNFQRTHELAAHLAEKFKAANPALDTVNAKVSQFLKTSETGFARFIRGAGKNLHNSNKNDMAEWLGITDSQAEAGEGAMSGYFREAAASANAPELPAGFKKITEGLKVIDATLDAVSPAWALFSAAAVAALDVPIKKADPITKMFSDLSAYIKENRTQLGLWGSAFKINFGIAMEYMKKAQDRAGEARDDLKKALADIAGAQKAADQRKFEIALGQAGTPEAQAKFKFDRARVLFGRGMQRGGKTYEGQALFGEAEGMLQDLLSDQNLPAGPGKPRGRGAIVMAQRQQAVVERFNKAMDAFNDRLRARFGKGFDNPDLLNPGQAAALERMKKEGGAAVLNRFGLGADPNDLLNRANVEGNLKAVRGEKIGGLRGKAEDLRQEEIEAHRNLRLAVVDSVRPLRDVAAAAAEAAKALLEIKNNVPGQQNDIAGVAARAAGLALLGVLGN